MAHANKLYVEQPLVEMRAAFDKDGLYGLSKRIHNLEVNFAENVYESRIWDQPDYHGYAEQLLAQVTPEMLHSILSNTLPADVISNRVTLEPWAKISLSPQHANSIDPGIYANFLAAQDGSAMDLKDFELFLDALDAALLGNRMANGQDICRDVNNYYNQQHRTVRNVVLLDATLRTNTLDKSRDTFIRLNRERLKDAQGQGATHITIPGECGWSKNVNARCQQHKKLESSPAIFRVANCVLHVLFPRKNFRMHHFCLMKAFRAEHAAVGESIGHHLVLSYAKYGGFNFAQAGFSVLGAMDMTFMEWQLACTSSVRVLNYIQARLDQEDAKLHVRLKRARVRRKRVRVLRYE
jgi:hypothetical protein